MSKGPLKFRNLHVFEWDMGNGTIIILGKDHLFLFTVIFFP